MSAEVTCDPDNGRCVRGKRSPFPELASRGYNFNQVRSGGAAITMSWESDNRYKPHRTYCSGLGLGQQPQIDWRDIITEAEQIVGYPTSFLNLRWLFNDEIASTAIHLRKLVGTNHPVLKSAKNLLVGSKSNLQSVGLIILLVSKAAGFDTREFTRDHYDSGVLHAQRALAEIVEMKRTGHMIHKAMVNLQKKNEHGDKFKDLLYGNKIVLLTG
uniref:Uncharacterized protein n=1 Tax=Heliothis virescens TaxID=7102 RepID=A0A2A4JH39_HELVI